MLRPIRWMLGLVIAGGFTAVACGGDVTVDPYWEDGEGGQGVAGTAGTGGIAGSGGVGASAGTGGIAGSGGAGASAGTGGIAGSGGVGASAGTGGIAGSGGVGASAGTGGIAGSGGVGASAGTGGVGNAGGIGGSAGSAGSGGTSPVDCLTCIGNSCPQTMDCLFDQGCRDGLICSVSQCMASGQPDFMCMIDCFNGDIGALLLALDTMTCVFGQCSDSCGGGLPF